MVFYDELQILMDEVADRVDRWTGNTAWVFEPGSAAAAEVANKEKRLDGSPWGNGMSGPFVGSHQVWPVTQRLIRTLASSRETPVPSALLIDVAKFGSAARSYRFAVRPE
jgi:hypothetical protein